MVECDYNTIIDNNTHLVPRIVKQPNQIKSAKLDVKQIEFIIIQ